MWLGVSPGQEQVTLNSREDSQGHPEHFWVFRNVPHRAGGAGTLPCLFLCSWPGCLWCLQCLVPLWQWLGWDLGWDWGRIWHGIGGRIWDRIRGRICDRIGGIIWDRIWDRIGIGFGIEFGIALRWGSAPIPRSQLGWRSNGTEPRKHQNPAEETRGQVAAGAPQSS